MDYTEINQKKWITSNDVNFNPRTGKYHCPTCNTGYARRDTVIGHYRYDCGQAPRYKCSYCGKLTKKKYNMNDHIKRKHPAKPLAFDVRTDILLTSLNE